MEIAWWVKMTGEKILDFIPLSHKIHRLFERAGTTKYLNSLRDEIVKARIARWKFIYENTSFDLKGKKVIEIGTGWNGIDLVFFHLFGAREIYTIDRLPHLNIITCTAGVEGLKMASVEIENIFGIEDVRKKLERLSYNSLDSFLRQMNVRYYVGKELKDIPLEDSSFDLFYAYSVLHMLPLAQLQRTLETARRILKKGAIFYSSVRFADINYNHQRSLNPYGYLRYPDWLWEIMQSRKFNY